MKKNILFISMLVLFALSLVLLLVDSIQDTMWRLLVLLTLPGATAIWIKTDFRKDDNELFPKDEK